MNSPSSLPKTRGSLQGHLSLFQNSRGHCVRPYENKTQANNWIHLAKTQILFLDSLGRREPHPWAFCHRLSDTHHTSTCRACVFPLIVFLALSSELHSILCREKQMSANSGAAEKNLSGSKTLFFLHVKEPLKLTRISMRIAIWKDMAGPGTITSWNTQGHI